MNRKIVEAHMKVAETYANLSYANRLKVGAIIVKEDRIVSIGYNGTPSGWSNDCEDILDGELITKKEVLHAEENAICKLAKSHESGHNSDMFITHAPCMQCSKLIFAAGIKNVYFRNIYRSEDGLEFLKKAGVAVQKI